MYENIKMSAVDELQKIYFSTIHYVSFLKENKIAEFTNLIQNYTNSSFTLNKSITEGEVKKDDLLYKVCSNSIIQMDKIKETIAKIKRPKLGEKPDFTKISTEITNLLTNLEEYLLKEKKIIPEITKYVIKELKE